MSSVVQSQQSSTPICQPQTGIPLRIATFFVLSILCHAATLHAAPGQFRRVTFARGLGMIFSPVTAGLYSLMSLGRMGVAWLSIAARTIELIARIMAPEVALTIGLPQLNPIPEGRRNTLPSTGNEDVVESPSTFSPSIRLARTMSAPDLHSTPHDRSPPLKTSDQPNDDNRQTVQPSSPEELLQR